MPRTVSADTHCSFGPTSTLKSFIEGVDLVVQLREAPRRLGMPVDPAVVLACLALEPGKPPAQALLLGFDSADLRGAQCRKLLGERRPVRLGGDELVPPPAPVLPGGIGAIELALQPGHVHLGPRARRYATRRFYRRQFKPAVVAAGLPAGLRFHDLRHTCAALLIAQGAHPRAIMERLGHSSVTVTIDTYGHLFPALDEALSDGLERTYQAARANRNETLVVQMWCRSDPDPLFRIRYSL